ncbi:S41 family peptidase [Thermanaeromonas sp. C210]|uniref:S41 family peptidase n=1 Tax=Thermanaeromonas sp. C210 TaxID=2731925 RepID=UPI00155C9EB5|nr:S41 family peptidase [Thermanaeromonas sp. C210]GFN21844.1 peptidase S41 [Thermanaeromonas sp. C210]
MLQLGRAQRVRLMLYAVLALGYFIFSPAALAEERGQTVPEWPLLTEVRELIEKNYAGEVDPYSLEEGAIRGMIRALGDPYSDYLSPREVEAFQQVLKGEYSGTGMVVAEENGVFTIRAVLPSSPAARQGIRPGGVLLRVDGKPLKGLPLEEVILLLRGEPGTRVTVEITWPWDAQPRSFTLVRELIRQPMAEAALLEGGVGYLAIWSFTSRTPEEVASSLEELEGKGARGLVLDLRGNSGGYLGAAVEVASLFLLEGTPVAQVVDKQGWVEVLRSEGPGIDWPVVVLVDGGTASAAELLAGALRDTGAALLVGTRTFGKGSIQSLLPLRDGGALKLTTAHYLTPAGRQIDGEGLEPDFSVDDPEEQLRTAVHLLQHRHPSAA